MKLASSSLASISKNVNRPSVTVTAILLSLWLGWMRFPFLQYLRPFGDSYVALLQICVLPFLLTTIPLAVRSALTSGMAGKVPVRLIVWLLITTAGVVLVSLLICTTLFHYMPVDQATTARIGTLFGSTTNDVGLNFALNDQFSSGSRQASESGLMAIIPVNVFSALSGNDSLRVIVFATLFGVGMAISEQRTRQSIFGAFRSIQSVCIMMFEWFNVLTPIGIVALIAPQVALLGPETYAILAPFVFAFFGTSVLLIVIPVFAIAIGLRAGVGHAFSGMLQVLGLAAATRNALICSPTALHMMKEDMHAVPEPCDLYIPIGFTVIRFGPLLHFVVAVLFVGHLVGRGFSGADLTILGALSVMASFATIGVAGIPGLAPLAPVPRAFGLSYELALPLLVIIDPIAGIIRAMLNVALNLQIPALAAGRRRDLAPAIAVAAE